MLMNIRDLKYLVALADHGHFGKAAETCFVSQPALSMQIMKLEENLGVKLLERTNKSILLTEHGGIIVERARHILSQIEEVREIAKSAKDPFSGELRIGVFPTLAPYLLPHIIPQLSKAYPKLSFYLIEEQTAVLVEQLKQGKLHAALLAHPVVDKSFNSALLFEEEFLLATPATHPLAKLKSVRQQDLDNKNLLLLEEGHCMRAQALALCQRMRANETQNFRATSLETLRHMVSAGVGITLIPKLACNLNDTISYIPFSAPKPSRSIGIYWRASTAKQVVLENIVAKIKLILAKQKAVRVIK
jgi:LysR family transcriptional regulator, hydrogen peroxide-inducible genes activator